MTELFDIAVIGAGPAGANAALTAARQGLRVVVLDEQPKPGGQVWRAKSAAVRAAPTTPETVAGDALRSEIAQAGLTHMGDTRVWQIERHIAGWQLRTLADGLAGLVRAKALILATGAREFVQPVPGWTTPGVIGLAGATALFKQELTVPGKRTVVSGTGPLVFFVASEIRRLGGKVAAVVTPNSRSDWARALPSMMSRPDLLRRGAVWIADLMLARVPILWRHAVTEVGGGTGVTSVQTGKLDADWSLARPSRRFEADSLCLGNGLIPAIEAPQLAGLSVHHHPELGGWAPEVSDDGGTAEEGLFLCGDGAGIRGVAAAQIHGQLAGLNASAYLGAKTSKERAALRPKYHKAARFGLAMTALSVPRPGLQGLMTPETIVCRCESLRKSDVELEIASGASSTNAVKSGLRAGMGPCGGKYCQTVVARLIANAEERPESDISPPTPRPPLRPVPASALAGEFEYGNLPIPKPAPL